MSLTSWVDDTGVEYDMGWEDNTNGKSTRVVSIWTIAIPMNDNIFMMIVENVTGEMTISTIFCAYLALQIEK